MKRLLFSLGALLLVGIEILRIYFIMPFPGSQHQESLPFAYFIGRNIWVLRFIGLTMVLWPVLSAIRTKKKRTILFLSISGLIYLTIFFFFNFRLEADKMFRQTRALRFSGADKNEIPPDDLVIGIDSNGISKAYPIRLLGYHHQVRDSIGLTPLMVTYCTVCRTGRVYSPAPNGVTDSFRLVGMDYFNAMFEDSRTHSWWQQATGVAVAGPLKGSTLPEWPSQQTTVQNWLRDHPHGLIMQPDSLFAKNYDDLKDYNKGLQEGSLEKRDSLSGSRKSWLVGVIAGQNVKAYDWNLLAERWVINDNAGAEPVVIYLETDTVSFHAWSRNVAGKTLWFEQRNGILTDTNTRSEWSPAGRCLSGPLDGHVLKPVKAYQEFLHSWTHFHPRTELFKP